VTVLQGVTAEGIVAADSLTVSRLTHRSLRVPCKIGNNTLLCGEISFAAYTGKGQAELRMAASSAGYDTTVRYHIQDADAAAFSDEAGFNTILGGRTTISTTLNGTLRSSADIPAALSGTWQILIENGNVSEKGDNGSPASSMPFHQISAAGDMKNGVLHTQNIRLQSRDLAAAGRAAIDLPAWTLDCQLNVSTRLVSNVPVNYSGSLDAPKRAINPLNAVAGAIGNVGNGLFGLVGDILSAPFRLLHLH
jgi:AsmA protein